MSLIISLSVTTPSALNKITNGISLLNEYKLKMIVFVSCVVNSSVVFFEPETSSVISFSR